LSKTDPDYPKYPRQKPRELIVAVPVASPDRLEEVRRWCDDVVCLLAPELFWAVGQFYEEFTQVEDEQAVQLLREFAPAARPQEAHEAVEARAC
jgi:predicted phosphoribosyltransferase